MMRPNKLECLCLANTFQSSLTFPGGTRSLSKKEASERFSNWVCSVQILRPDWKGFPMANPLAYWASLSVTKEKSFITLTFLNNIFLVADITITTIKDPKY